MKAKLRLMKFTDIKKVDELNRKCLPENYTINVWINWYKSGGNKHSYVCTAPDVIGYILSVDGHIMSFAVEDKYRGKGIGAALLGKCIDSYLGIRESITLNVRVDSRAQSLYRKYGFEVAERSEKYYGDCDAYFMKAKISKFNITNRIRI